MRRLYCCNVSLVVDVLVVVGGVDAEVAGEVAKLRVERGIESAVLQACRRPKSA